MTPAAFSSSALPGTAGAAHPCDYGGFRLGALHLAVPMSALREIVPCDTLVPLRGKAACIAGGIQHGNAVIPVVDLRSALAQPLGSAPGASVLLVSHDGALLGLLAHEVTGVMAGVHQGHEARVVLHRPREVMARSIPPSAATLEAIDATRCLMRCGAGQLDSLVYWLLALEVEFDVLEPPVLKERLRLASERVVRSLDRSAGGNIA